MNDGETKMQYKPPGGNYVHICQTSAKEKILLC